MKSRKTLLFITLALCLLVFGCGTPAILGTQEIPKTSEPKPVDQAATEPQFDATEAAAKPTAIPPTETSPSHAKAQIGYYMLMELTYDPSVWQAVLQASGNQTTHGQDAYELIHQQYGCSLHDNLGHGVPETWTVSENISVINDVEFQVTQWVDSTTGEAVLVVYHTPPNDWENYHRVELVIDGHASECIQAAESVIGLSAKGLAGE